MYCESCGSYNPETNAFCECCGAPIKAQRRRPQGNVAGYSGNAGVIAQSGQDVVRKRILLGAVIAMIVITCCIFGITVYKMNSYASMCAEKLPEIQESIDNGDTESAKKAINHLIITSPKEKKTVVNPIRRVLVGGTGTNRAQKNNVTNHEWSPEFNFFIPKDSEDKDDEPTVNPGEETDQNPNKGVGEEPVDESDEDEDIDSDDEEDVDCDEDEDVDYDDDEDVDYDDDEDVDYDDDEDVDYDDDDDVDCDEDEDIDYDDDDDVDYDDDVDDDEDVDCDDDDDDEDFEDDEDYDEADEEDDEDGVFGFFTSLLKIWKK